MKNILSSRSYHGVHYFPVRKQRVIILPLVSLISVVFAAGTFIPSMPQIALELDSTPEIIRWDFVTHFPGTSTLEISNASVCSQSGCQPLHIFYSFGSLDLRSVFHLLYVRSYSLSHHRNEICPLDGRRIAYLTGSPLLCLGSIGVCLSRTVPELLVARCIQALGTSGGTAIGASVIGDIYKLTERGRGP